MRVLLLADNVSIRKINGAELPGVELVGASDLVQAMDLIDRDSIDIVMVSYEKQDAPECCEIMKARCDIPITLIVREKDINWREISYLAIDGFIPENSSGDEIKARLHAISRRCQQYQIHDR